jgi:hypothetical protein
VDTLTGDLETVLDLARSEGWAAFWWLENGLEVFPGYPTARAALSAVEGGLADGVTGATLVEVGR